MIDENLLDFNLECIRFNLKLRLSLNIPGGAQVFVVFVCETSVTLPLYCGDVWDHCGVMFGGILGQLRQQNGRTTDENAYPGSK